MEALLLDRGANDDIFTHALLGDLPRLRDDLVRDPSTAQANDPAVDALRSRRCTTPSLASTSKRCGSCSRSCPRADAGQCARAAAGGGARERRDRAADRQRGVDATTLGPGRWVLHPELAPLLSAAGAQVDRSGGWIGLSCTGNQGRKDDPEYVAALLGHGARADDRRLVGQGSDGGHATALHYAARAGFSGRCPCCSSTGPIRVLAMTMAARRPIGWIAPPSPSIVPRFRRSFVTLAEA